MTGNDNGRARAGGLQIDLLGAVSKIDGDGVRRLSAAGFALPSALEGGTGLALGNCTGAYGPGWDAGS